MHSKFSKLHVSQFPTKFNCGQSLFLRTGRAVKETQKWSVEAETGCILLGNTTLKTSRLITLTFTHSRFTVSDLKIN